MRLSELIPFLLLPTALADFHVGRVAKETIPFGQGQPIKWTASIACPSNYLNCNCYGQMQDNADRGVGTNPPRHDIGGDFSLAAGLCGMGQLNFYYRSDRGVWEFYVANGDGKVQGTCYKNSASDWCSRGAYLDSQYTDKMWCSTHICN